MYIFLRCGHWLGRTAVLASGVFAFCAYAQPAFEFPRKTVRIVVPIAPGGGTDIIARLIAQKLGELWSQSVVVENQGGGGSTIGTHNVVKSSPDGYTLLLTSTSVAYIAPLYRKLPFDPQKDLAPVALVAAQPSMIVVHPSLPVRSVRDLISLAQARPREILYASGGSGSASHLAVELFRSTAKIEMVHVPYKGAGPAGLAVMAGEAQMLITNIASLLPQVKAGRLRGLAVTGTSRSGAAPDLPTAAEAGLGGYEFNGWYGLLAPAKTPPGVLRKVSEDIGRSLAAADLRERFAVAGIEPLGSTPESFASYLASETTKWTHVVHTAGIRAD